MNDKVAYLKYEIKKLKQVNYEKSEEVLALVDQNAQLLKRLEECESQLLKRQSTDINIGLDETYDIIPYQHSPNPKTQILSASEREITLTKNPSTTKESESNRLEKMIQYFKGEFPNIESSNTLIPIYDWEFVIVCKNPDFKDEGRVKISKKFALKYFKGGLKLSTQIKSKTLV
jgi:hypothetical protein